MAGDVVAPVALIPAMAGNGGAELGGAAPVVDEDTDVEDADTTEASNGDGRTKG